jgi:DNA-binding transcriptional ArsR family regulator
MPEWTFITKHAVALSLIAKHPRITALELGAAMGLTERVVRKLIADLYAAGYISKKREGRGIRYRINPDLPMRHETHREVAIGDFLEPLGWKRPQRKERQRTATGEIKVQ